MSLSSYIPLQVPTFKIFLFRILSSIVSEKSFIWKQSHVKTLNEKNKVDSEDESRDFSINFTV